MAEVGDPAGDVDVAGLNASNVGTVRLGVVSLCLVQFVDVLGVTVMVTALPAMLADLRASPDAASLISTWLAGAPCSGPVCRWLCCWPLQSAGPSRQTEWLTGRSGLACPAAAFSPSR
jgi:hypothetical protein